MVFWVKHKVPFHYPWTPDEMGLGRFNAHAERRGLVYMEFRSEYEYYIIDFLGFGARLLINWNEIRAYAERFNPLGIDEPHHLRSPPDPHLWELEDFAASEIGGPINKLEIFKEDTAVTKEKWKNKFAPHPGRTFNPFDRKLNTPIRVIEQAGTMVRSLSPGFGTYRYIGDTTGLEVIGEWGNDEHEPEYRVDQEVAWQAFEREMYEPETSSVQEEEVPDMPPKVPQHLSRSDYGYQTFPTKVFEPKPTRNERKNPVWNLDWLKHCVLVYKDPYAHIGMKVIAAADPEVKDFTDVLNTAWKFGLQFYLYMPENKVRLFSRGPITQVDQLALPRMFDVRHTENFMNKISGNRAQYHQWLISAMEVVKCSNTVAFITEGGILSEIAQALNNGLVDRQLRSLPKGDKILINEPPGGGPSAFYTASSISEGEGLILVGYIAGVGAEPDKYLFPMQAMLDEFSDHFHGMVGEGACQIISNLLACAESNPSWLTESGCKSYLRSNWGKHKPKYVTMKDEFREMGDKLACSFPLNWQYINVGEIRIPERFDTRAARN
ncbi:hypothetical protein C8R45DRAFT_933157 [Mycena sanguinolenta]|nr:hypothetical protein C8R45DRAFT_933157 [Mycena sanguinolenta]